MCTKVKLVKINIFYKSDVVVLYPLEKDIFLVISILMYSILNIKILIFLSESTIKYPKQENARISLITQFMFYSKYH